MSLTLNVILLLSVAEASAGEIAKANTIVSTGKPSALYDFGTVAPGVRLNVEFAVKNDSPNALEFRKATTTCGCLSFGRGWERVAPQAEGKILLILDTNKQQGRVEQVAEIQTENPRFPRIRLTVVATVSGIWTEPSEINLGSVSADRPSARASDLFVLKAGFPSSRITSIEFPPGPVTFAELDATADARTRGKQIDVLRNISLQWVGAAVPPGSFQSNLVIHTDAPEHPTVNVPIHAFVTTKIAAIPQKVIFGKVVPGARVKRQCSLRLVRPEKGEHFSALQLHVDDNCVTGTLEVDEHDPQIARLSLVLECPAGRAPGLLRGVATGLSDKRPMFVVPYLAYIGAE